MVRGRRAGESHPCGPSSSSTCRNSLPLYMSFLSLVGGEGNGTPLQYSCLENSMAEEPGRLQSMGSLRVGHDWVTSLSLFTFMHWRRKWQPTPVFLPGESQGRRSLVGCHLWGCTESDTTEVMQQQQQQQTGNTPAHYSGGGEYLSSWTVCFIHILEKNIWELEQPVPLLTRCAEVWEHHEEVSPTHCVRIDILTDDCVSGKIELVFHVPCYKQEGRREIFLPNG